MKRVKKPIYKVDIIWVEDFRLDDCGTVKPQKWWPQKWRTSLDGGWYLDLLFLKWRGKTSENGGF